METEKKKSKFWIYLIPIYIIIAIPLIKWTLKISSSDINLSEEDMKAFSGKSDIKKDEDYKFYEPNLEDLSYTITYRNTSDLKEIEEKKQSQIEEKKDKKKKEEIRPAEEQTEIPSVNEIKQKEMSSVGYKKGFLTQAVGKLLNNPKAVQALFNNDFVVKGFLSRDVVKRNLSDPKALESYLSNQSIVSNFLNNDVVKQALNNPQIINVIAQSKMMNEIMNSNAVTTLLNDQNKVNNLLTQNPQISQLLANPNVISALATNPQGSKILSGVGNK
ncbi:MAG: hypothetical protein K6357_02495 [Elusimicrobiota bacterium]